MEEISYAGPSNSGGKRLSKRLLVFGGLFLLVLLLLGSAIYFITREKSPKSDDSAKAVVTPENKEASPTPTIEPSVSPSTTPSKSVSKSPTPSTVAAKSDINIAVQNGSGVTGAAAKAAAVLKAVGYTISSTGNADTSDYTDVTVKVKKSQKAELTTIEKALAKDYTVGTTSSDLPESASYDVLVIVGK
jgi:cytoskeletal protein RodZ